MTVDITTVDTETVDIVTVDLTTADNVTVDITTVDTVTVDITTVDIVTVDITTVDITTVDIEIVDRHCRQLICSEILCPPEKADTIPEKLLKLSRGCKHCKLNSTNFPSLTPPHGPLASALMFTLYILLSA